MPKPKSLPKKNKEEYSESEEEVEDENINIIDSDKSDIDSDEETEKKKNIDKSNKEDICVKCIGHWEHKWNEHYIKHKDNKQDDNILPSIYDDVCENVDCKCTNEYCKNRNGKPQ